MMSADYGGEPQSFGAALRQLRQLRQARDLSLTDLSELVHYSKGYLGKLERGDQNGTLDVARRCDEALDAGGALARLVMPASRTRRPGTALPRPMQLPPRIPDFIGRTSYLRQLDGLMSSGDGASGPGTMVISAISGPAGVGKTALAVSLGTWCAGSFPRRQLRWPGHERHLRRDPRPRAPVRIRHPGLVRNVEPPIDQHPIPPRGDVGQKGRDLAVVNPPQRPGVLPLHTHRHPALFREPGRICDQDPLRISQLLHRVLTVHRQQPIRIPRGQIQEPLQRFRFPFTHPLRDRPPILPLQRRQQPTKILLGVPP